MRVGSSVHVSGHTVYSAQQQRTSTAERPERLRTHLNRIDAEVNDLSKLMAQIRGSGRGARSAFATGRTLNFQEGTPAVLQSAEELNTEATQMSSRTPQWSGPGGRTVDVRGVYNGPDDDTLTFTMSTASGRKIHVTNAAGDTVDTINLNGSGNAVSAPTVDGLTIDLGAGSLTDGDSFTLQVLASQDGAVDAGDSFNGVGDASARFEEGTTITDGSFQVNGTTVSVSAGDSLNDVLARITSQVDGVTATYDATTERVRLQTDDIGPSQSIEITGDTSGLIAALKLDGQGQAVGGGDPQSPTTLLNELIGFEGVTTGTLTINGTDISIDPANQSVTDVLEAIRDIEGVHASLDSMDRVVIYGSPGEILSLSDTSGFLDAAGIAAGDRRGRESQRKIGQFAAQRLAVEIGQLRSAIDGLMDDDAVGVAGARVKTKLAGAIDEAFADAGLEDFAGEMGLLNFADDDLAAHGKRVRTVQRSYGSVRDMMIGQRHQNTDGLLDSLDDILDDARRGVDLYA